MYNLLAKLAGVESLTSSVCVCVTQLGGKQVVKGRNEPCCLFSFAAVYFPVGPQFVYPCGGGLVAETLLHMSILLHIENFEGGKNLRFTRGDRMKNYCRWLVALHDTKMPFSKIDSQTENFLAKILLLSLGIYLARPT
jgi:hypothetical protein